MTERGPSHVCFSHLARNSGGFPETRNFFKREEILVGFHLIRFEYPGYQTIFPTLLKGKQPILRKDYSIFFAYFALLLSVPTAQRYTFRKGSNVEDDEPLHTDEQYSR